MEINASPQKAPIDLPKRDVQQHLIENRESSTSFSMLQAALAITVALFGICIFALVMNPAAMDAIEYWSSARLLLHRVDPYSPAGVFALEKARGFLPGAPLVMLNPPWILFLILPLGIGGIKLALFFWTLVAFGCILAFIRLLKIPSRNSSLALLFAPVIACLCSGQSSPILLLGFCLFLRFHRDRPLIAGASLLLMAIKPHLFLVFWVVLLVDCIYQHKFRILAGGAAALVCASIFPMFLDAHVWQHYVEMLQLSSLRHVPLPTMSMVLRTLIDVRAFWLLFVPSGIAILWGVWYYSRNRHEWNWATHGMLLMVVTILVSPYGFFTDEIVLLPSIAYALSLPEKRRYSLAVFLAINTAALVPLVMPHASLSSHAFLWTPLAWFTWFLYSKKQSARDIETFPPHSQKPRRVVALEGELNERIITRTASDC